MAKCDGDGTTAAPPPFDLRGAERRAAAENEDRERRLAQMREERERKIETGEWPAPGRRTFRQWLGIAGY